MAGATAPAFFFGLGLRLKNQAFGASLLRRALRKYI
jgi:hypothetical protein